MDKINEAGLGQVVNKDGYGKINIEATYGSVAAGPDFWALNVECTKVKHIGTSRDFICLVYLFSSSDFTKKGALHE